MAGLKVTASVGAHNAFSAENQGDSADMDKEVVAMFNAWVSKVTGATTDNATAQASIDAIAKKFDTVATGIDAITQKLGAVGTPPTQ